MYKRQGLGYVTYKQYDRLGRVRAHGDYLNAAAGVAREKKVLESYVPVSYTHLDVYKRQRWCRRMCVATTATRPMTR